MSRLPRWVEYGAFVLAFVAGMVNAIGLLGFKHQSISHLSGTATLVGAGVITSPFNELWHLMGVLLAFLLGASFSGFMLSSSALKLGRHYDLLLATEGTLLVVATYLLNNESLMGHYLASAACGVQNALATTYSGAIVRTTHVTGIFTDLGIMLGARLRGEVFDRRKAVLFVLIILGFTSGGTAGALIFIQIEFFALVVPAVMCFLLALGYRVYRATAR